MLKRVKICKTNLLQTDKMSSTGSSPQPTTLLDFPVDIIDSVFQILSPNDLCAVSLACTHLRKLAEPFLYSRISWTWETSRTPPIIHLLRSILSRPELAAHVQSLTLDGDTFHLTEYAGRPPKLSVIGPELDQPIAFIERLNVPHGDLWIKELRAGTMDAFIAVLLAQLSQLRYLRVAPNFAKESQSTGMVLKSALCDSVDRGLSKFERLQDVSFNIKTDMSRERGVRNTTDVLPFFYLPEIQHISASIDNPVIFEWPAIHAPTPSKLTSLDLTIIREEHLGHILSATTCLKTLTWKWYYREPFRDQSREPIIDRFGKPVIDLDQIFEAMAPVRDTLTELAISAACDMSQASPEPPPLAIKGSLKGLVEFNALKRLEVPLPFLFGFSPQRVRPLKSIMPRNIEFLTIKHDLWLQEENEMDACTVVGTIRLWLENGKQFTPHLRSIFIVVDPTDDEWCAETRDELKGICDPAGVQVDIGCF